MKKQELQNPNSSGQGFYPEHIKHPLYKVVVGLGYQYSHSTNIGTLDGTGWHLHHSFFFPGTEHSVTLREADRGDYREPIKIWSTKVGGGSGYEWDGNGDAELIAHLKSKRRRYGLVK